MKLSGYLPESLFQPLAGPKRHIYARLLISLYEKVFAARVLETPTREDILRHIAIALPESGVHSSDELREEGAEGDANPHAPLPFPPKESFAVTLPHTTSAGLPFKFGPTFLTISP
jgi:hypothetical protein